MLMLLEQFILLAHLTLHTMEIERAVQVGSTEASLYVGRQCSALEHMAETVADRPDMGYKMTNG